MLMQGDELMKELPVCSMMGVLCMGRVLGKGGIRVCAHPTGSCGFAHENKLNLEPGYYVMHGDFVNHLLPSPSISLQDAEDYPEDLQTLVNAELSTDKLSIFGGAFQTSGGCWGGGCCQGCGGCYLK